MATLDYVIMSEFARIDPSGLVTVVGGSFDRVQAPERSVGQQLFVTLRALLEVETSVLFEVKVRPPTGEFEIGIRGRMIERGVTEEDLQQCLNEHVQRVQTARQNQY